MTTDTQRPFRFPSVSCSQCGQDFGPGNHGYSHCDNHQSVATVAPQSKIITEHVYPPIPIRSFDWCAWFDGMDEETRGQGWGKTEAEAIANLKEMYGVECRQCGRHEQDVRVCGVGGCPIGADL